MAFVKCEKCGVNYQPDHGCGMAVICGKPFVIHCSEVYANRHELETNSFQLWEAPANNCPYCWHKDHPEKLKGHGL